MNSSQRSAGPFPPSAAAARCRRVAAASLVLASLSWSCCSLVAPSRLRRDVLAPSGRPPDAVVAVARPPHLVVAADRRPDAITSSRRYQSIDAIDRSIPPPHRPRSLALVPTLPPPRDKPPPRDDPRYKPPPAGRSAVQAVAARGSAGQAARRDDPRHEPPVSWGVPRDNIRSPELVAITQISQTFHLMHQPAIVTQRVSICRRFLQSPIFLVKSPITFVIFSIFWSDFILLLFNVTSNTKQIFHQINCF